jgi:putative membrane protein
MIASSPLPEWMPYCGAAPLPGEWWARWNLDPVLLAALLLAAFAVQAAPLARTGPRRPFFAAIGLTALLFVSPLCALGSALFVARTVHHVVLVTALAALLASVPLVARTAARLPLAGATGLHVAVLWAWHAPPLYAAALSHDGAFWAMQASLVATAALFWAGVRRAEAGAAVIALLATMVLTGLLGALLAFAGRAFYAPHWLTTQAWGLTPLEDQQLAGLVMWAPGSAIYLLAACAILYRALGGSQRQELAR